MRIQDIQVHPVKEFEKSTFKHLMQHYHYLGAPHPVGEVIDYVATWQGHWVALISFASAALKCRVRDQWIGWTYRHQFDRLHLLTSNRRFLILPQWHYPNLATKVLSLCQRRIAQDWLERFHHPLLLLETFVDPQRFRGTLYKAANWIYLGRTQGYRRINNQGYQANGSPKLMFVYPLQRHTTDLLSQPHLPSIYQYGAPKLMLNTHHMHTLPDYFKSIPDPRRAQGLRHRLSVVLSIAAAATLCGREGYKAIAEWAKELNQSARARFNCYYHQGQYHVPSTYVIREVLTRIDPDALDHALQKWNDRYAPDDESLAIDGKTLCNAIDNEGKKTHIISAVGHDSHVCRTQKKSVNYL